MAVQIIMGHNTGDTRHEFKADDAVGLAEAEARFKELTGKGFRAAALGKDGEPGQLIKAFDPNVERTLFIQPLQGG